MLQNPKYLEKIYSQQDRVVTLAVVNSEILYPPSIPVYMSAQ